MQSLNLYNKGNYTIVEIDNGKVNAINAQLAKDLAEAFTQLQADETVKGVILSGRPHCFSAGLDVGYLAAVGEEGGVDFWIHYHNALKAMLGFTKPFVCAITGYAPAGGTILTLTADYRIMGRGDKHKIGMHEFKMSMLVPKTMCDIWTCHLGERLGWNYMLNAQLFSSDEAQEIGLVDESCEVEEVLERAEKKLKQYMKVNTAVYEQSKIYLRKEMRAIAQNIDAEAMAKEFVSTAYTPELMAMMKGFLASLKK